MDISNELEERLIKAKIHLFNNKNVFVSNIAFNLKHVWDDTIDTARVDGTTIRYNPNFINSLDKPKMFNFITAHEVWHVALNHLTRGGDKDHKVYGKAADYVINLMLVENGYEMPTINGKKAGLLDHSYRGMSTEEVYDILIKDPNNTPDSPMDGDIVYVDSNGELSEEEKEELNSNLTLTIVRALNAHNMSSNKEPGQVPGEIQALIGKLLKTKVPWHTILDKYLTDMSAAEYSWKKVNKRYFPEFILPSIYSESLEHIALAIDLSGSQTNKELNSILSKINQLHIKFRPKKLTLIGFDYLIREVYTVTENDKIQDLKFTGRGGTNFKPVFEHLNNMKDKPKVLIVFTDLYGREVDMKPSYDVIWICNSNHPKPKLGKTIYME